MATATDVSPSRAGLEPAREFRFEEPRSPAAALAAGLLNRAIALDDESRRFYEHFGFEPLADRPNHLWLPMKTVAVLFGEAESGGAK